MIILPTVYPEVVDEDEHARFWLSGFGLKQNVINKKEPLAVIQAVKRFLPFQSGTKLLFKTDHASLQ